MGTRGGLPPLFGFPWEKESQPASPTSETHTSRVSGIYIWFVPVTKLTERQVELLEYRIPALGAIPDVGWRLIKVLPASEAISWEEARERASLELASSPPGAYVVAVGRSNKFEYEVVRVK